jgi:phage-related protein
MSPTDKPLVWLHGEVLTPPFSHQARVEAGYYLRLLQKGVSLSLPHSGPMLSIGRGCHELRITDKNKIWRIIYRIDDDAIIIGDVFEKKTPKTPLPVINTCKNRFKNYDAD